MGKDKEQIAFRVTPQMKREIDLIMDSDGSRTRNEFLEHAVQFYIDHLLERSMTTLPVSVTSAIDGRLGMLEDRLSALQFNNSVELDMLVQIIAGQYDLSPGYLRKLRSDSVKNVKQTSGRVSLANAARENTSSWLPASTRWKTAFWTPQK